MWSIDYTSLRSNGLSLKYQWFIFLGCKDIGTRNFEFEPKSSFAKKNVRVSILSVMHLN